MKRIGLMLITFVIIVTLTYFILNSIPFDPIRQFMDPETGEIPTWAWAVIEREGWNLPIYQRFFLWLRGIFGDYPLGYTTSQNVNSSWEVIVGRIPVTIGLNIIPFFLAIPLGITLGIVAALKKNKWQDHTISTFVMFFISVPTFVLAVLLQQIIVFNLRWIPTPFVFSRYEAALDPWGNVVSRILPTVVLTLGPMAGWTRSIRAELTEVLTSDFLLLARTKGLTTRQATVRHALRSALVPFAPAIFVGFIGLMSGSIIIEQIFRVPGVGRIFLEAFNARDINLFMAVNVFFIFIGLCSGIAGDISFGFLDPRIRMGGGKE